MRTTILIYGVLIALSQLLMAKPSEGQVLKKSIDIAFHYNMTLYEAIQQLQAKGQLEFAFDEQILQLEKIKIGNKDFKGAPIGDVLDVLLMDTDVDYKVKGRRTVVLSKKKQLIRINGVVRDGRTATVLPGVSVSVSGSGGATATDNAGRYTISVPNKESVLVFRYMGYRAVEVAVGDRQTIDVTMDEDNNPLSEVVVTALGITKEAKSIGFSTQTVDGNTLQESHETNLLNTLNGRVAGVRITNSAGDMGASANIQIRGQNFVSGYNYNNSPLFVVDGVPISNNNEQSTRSFTGRQDFNNPNFNTSSTGAEGEVDYGNAAGELNPNDIESITVLKGPNAAALYGSRAANGVVLITTKSGKGQKGVGISFNSQASIENPLKLPDYQYEYGQGQDGQYSYVNGMGGGINDNALQNWGPPMNGQLIPQFDSPVDPVTGERIATPFVAYPDQLKDFFQTGRTYTNNLAIAGSNDKLNFRFSYTNHSQAGIVPNTDLGRNAISLNSGYAISPKLKFDANINYVNSGSDNRTSYGAKNDDAIMKIFLNMPRNVDVNSLRNYWQEGTSNTQQNSPIWGANNNRLNNPYFVVYENLNGNNRDRVYGNVRLNYNILPDLSLMLRSGRDFYNDKRTMRYANSSAQYVNGSYQEDDIYFLETNHDALLSYNTKLGTDFTVNASLGGNLMAQEPKRMGATAERLAIPNVYNLTNNASPIIAGNMIQHKKINSVYGTAQIGYKEALFLDLTGRNDWSSALPKQSRSYFYPSAALSLVASELFGWSGNTLNYLKLRSSIASVRRDLEPYQTATNFQVSQGWNGETVAVHNNNYPNPDIRPEQVNSYEFGFDSRFLGNRVGIDFTYYHSTTTDLIIPVTLNPSAGYDTKLMNVGKMTNRGVELMLDLVPVRTSQFNWNLNVNFGLNRNKVIELAEDLGISRIRQLERWASLELRTENTKGDGSFGSLYGDYLIYNSDGTLTHRNGLPQEENGDWGYLGNINPDWTAGVTNQFDYKNLSFSFLFGFQEGGVVHSRTYIEGNRNGSLKESLLYRDAQGAGTMVGEGIDVNTGQQNSTEVTVRNYWREYYNNDRIATFDASYIKLREVKLSYRFPDRLFRQTPIRQLTFSLVGRNLLLWDDVPNVDPEVSSYDGQFQGVESFSLPSLRSFGAALNVNF